MIPHDSEMGIPGAGMGSDRYGSATSAKKPGLVARCISRHRSYRSPRPCYTGKNKEAIFERGLPGPFDGFMGKHRDYHEYFVEKARTYEFCGRPVAVYPSNPISPQRGR